MIKLCIVVLAFALKELAGIVLSLAGAILLTVTVRDSRGPVWLRATLAIVVGLGTACGIYLDVLTGRFSWWAEGMAAAVAMAVVLAWPPIPNLAGLARGRRG